jgi:hypothetical protein
MKRAVKIEGMRKRSGNETWEGGEKRGEELGLMSILFKTECCFPCCTKVVNFLKRFLLLQPDDRLGRLKLTRAGLSKRNKMVFNAAKRAGARIVTTMGGGYGLLRSCCTLTLLVYSQIWTVFAYSLFSTP